MNKNRFFILLLTTAFIPLMWWFFVQLFPEFSRLLYSFNKYHPFQKTYWYVFFSSHHIKDIIVFYIIHSSHKFQSLKTFTKWLYIYQILLFFEYLILAGRFPILAFTGIVVFIGLDLYKNN